MTPPDERFMRLAIEATRKGIAQGQTPFGACIVRGGDVVACEHNVVWAECDITAHAEVHAIRAACRRLKSVDLSGCTIYSTTEPCPMCFSAIHWARIGRIVYGADIADAQEAGFSELAISNDRMCSEGRSALKLKGGVLAAECRELFRVWKETAGARTY
jgi:guanine deaminase